MDYSKPQTTRPVKQRLLGSAFALLGSSYVLGVGAGALAQDKPAQTVGVEEVIVTAQRTNQNIQNVPIAVTAYSAEQLARAGIKDVNDLAGIAPSFQLRDVSTTRQFNIRGSVSTNFNPAPESPVAVYTDDIYHGVPAAQLGDYFDVDRVEVLRGPQGTLFGRNSTGGLVQVISRAPSATAEGYVIGSIGSYNSYGLEAAGSAPLTDSLRARLAFKLDRDDGWQENAQVGGPNWASKDHVSGRLYLTYAPSDTFDASLIGSIARHRDRSQGQFGLGAIDPASVKAATVNGIVNTNLLRGCTSHSAILSGSCVINNGGPATAPSSYTPSRATNNSKKVYSSARGLSTDLDVENVALKMHWQLASGTELQSISTFEHVKQDHTEDNNTTGFVARDQGYDHGLIDASQFTQELIARHSFGAVSLQGGGYYLHSRREQTQGTDALDGIPFAYPDEPTLEVDSIAAFAEASIQFTPQFKGILGARYTRDAKSIDFKGTDFSNPTTTPKRFSRSDDVGRPSGRAVLEYHPNDKVMFYASAASGFSAAEYKLNYYGNITSQRLADPETNITYEIGEKALLWDDRLVLNVSVFHSNTKNKQGSQLIPDPRNPGQSITDFGNYGDVLAEGVEFEATLRPIEHLTFGLSGAYDHTRLTSPLVLTRGFDLQKFPLNGNSMVATPEWSFYAYGRATAPAPDGGEFSAQASYRWQSKVYWNLSNNPLEAEDPYGVARVELGWTSESKAYEVSAFVDNVFDETYSNLHVTFATSDIDVYLFAPPRWFGLRVQRNF